jgi:hypothetical protein
MYIHPTIKRYNSKNPFPPGLLYWPENFIRVQKLDEKEWEAFQEALSKYQQSNPNAPQVTFPSTIKHKSDEELELEAFHYDVKQILDKQNAKT